MALTPDVQNALNVIQKALGAPVPVVPDGYSSAYPDNVAKIPLPSKADDEALVAGVNAFLDKTYPVLGTPQDSMYPQASKLHDANVYVGTTLAKVTAYYQHCFGTGAYGGVQGSPGMQNNQARTAAFTTGHDNITDKLVSYCSYVKAPLPEKNQLV